MAAFFMIFLKIHARHTFQGRARLFYYLPRVSVNKDFEKPKRKAIKFCKKIQKNLQKSIDIAKVRAII